MDLSNAWNNTSSAFKAQVIGKLLGDGCLTKQAGRKPRFQFIHTASDHGWSLYCYDSLKQHLNLNPPSLRKIIDSRLKNGFTLSHYTQSKTSLLATFLRNTWYPDSVKRIPFDQLHEHFTVESLAWWYMDDGHLKYKNDKPLKIILSTDSFTKKENERLIVMLFEKYSLKFKIDKQNRIILYDQYQIHYFLYLVTPYIHFDMYRKMVNQFSLPKINNEKRTTLYLPKEFIFKKPTEEINQALVNLDKMINIYKQGNFYKIYHGEVNLLQKETRPYQIVLSSRNLSNIEFLNEATGLSMSKIAELVFISPTCKLKQ